MTGPVRNRLLTLYVALLFSSLPACGKAPVQWTEDVLLADGRVLTVTRHSQFNGPREVDHPPQESEWWMEFRHPDTGESVRWKSNSDVMPVALLINAGKTQLLVSLSGDGLSTFKCADPPYLLYSYQSGRWTQVPLSELRGRKIHPNMTYAVTDVEETVARTPHLNAGQAQSFSLSRTYDLRGADIDFRQFGEQIFGDLRRCNPPFNYMPDREGTAQ
jgi:hypothetical protein